MELLADRFLLLREKDRAFDLATAAYVRLVMSSQGGVAEQAEWAARCAHLEARRHPLQPLLVDYGVVGETRRFEAWRPFTIEPERCSAASVDASTVNAGSIPAADERPALRVIPRPSLLPITQWLSMPPSGGRAVSIWGPPGAGMNTALHEVARQARLRGVVPVCPAVLRMDARAVLQGRTLLVIARDQDADAWRALLDAATASGRRHFLVLAGSHDIRGTVPVVLERFSAAALVDSARGDAGGPIPPRVAAAASAARGLPADFAARLWGAPVWRPLADSRAPRRTPGAALRVAEPTVDYGEAPPSSSAAQEWPIPADVMSLRQRLRELSARISTAPRAATERELRQVQGALARRQDWNAAAEGALVLAGLLTTRGRLASAAAAVMHARDLAAKSGEIGLMLQASMLAGLHALDRHQLDESEAMLETARTTARGTGDDGLLRTASVALAECLFWRGRFDEAAHALTGWPDDDAAVEVAVHRCACLCRIAIARGRLADAVAHGRRALALADSGSASMRAAALDAAAQAHLAVGDAAAVSADVAAGLEHARRAYHPLLAISLRLSAAEAARREGRRSEAMRLVVRLTRPRGPKLPAPLSGRVQLLRALLDDDPGDAAARLAKTTGLGGLVTFAPSAAVPAPATAVVACVLELMRCCQTADDDRAVVEGLCAQLQTVLRARAVGAFVTESGQLTPIALAGDRLDHGEAWRIQACTDAVEPRAAGPGTAHGGVAVRWGGQVVGVLLAAWAAADVAAAADVKTLLGAAALAVAPALAAERMRRPRPPAAVPELLGISASMAAVRAAIERAAPAPFSVLVEGESGSGKELVARALHRRSPRRDRVCCAVNCAALPDDLLESELFGHARGAFTGALAERTGVFEEAHGGTLFLDEVGELSPRAQAKLLRAIQEGEIRRVGENVPRRVDVRLVAATNRDLRAEAAAGRFRQDLLYRLDVIRITLPPLRERVEDIALLAEQCWRDAAERVGSRATLGAATLSALAQYRWPGNVRELQNVMAALAVRAPRRGVVTPAALPPFLAAAATERPWRLDAARRSFEASFVRSALARAGGRRSRAAQELGITRQGLAKLIARLGLDAPRPQSYSDATATEIAR